MEMTNSNDMERDMKTEMDNQTQAFQDQYPEWAAQCYGCGRLNEHGLHIKSYWDGDEGVCRFRPKPFHTAMAGFVYGGLIASLIDCHSTGTAAAAYARKEGKELGDAKEIRFVTGSLHVDYLKPTPIGTELEIRTRVEEMKGRKVVVASELTADGAVCAKGRVIAVLIPESMMK